MSNIFEVISATGDDGGFTPMESDEFEPTDAPVGSREKLKVMAERVERGFPIWHPRDWPTAAKDDSLAHTQ